MKICDICGKSGIEVEDLTEDNQSFDACSTCDNAWDLHKAKLRAIASKRLSEEIKLDFNIFLTKKGQFSDGSSTSSE